MLSIRANKRLIRARKPLIRAKMPLICQQCLLFARLHLRMRRLVIFTSISVGNLLRYEFGHLNSSGKKRTALRV